ncbi:MAG: hypothetical protein ACREGI_04960, partial [Candidatus Levyibacteriota bacterium]
DGVIAVDLSVVQSLIAALGNVYIPEYNQIITSDTFFTLAESHAEKNFFPGSSQKKDFLNSVFSSVMGRFLQRKQISYRTLLTGFLENLSQKHILVAFADSGIQNVFTVNDFSSTLWDGRSQSANTVNDYFGISEANVGVNKVNYFVKRSVSQDIKIGEKGQIQEHVQITYKNTSTGTWPGGDYKNYLRLILPLGATISTISINKQQQVLLPAIINPTIYEAKNFTPPNGLEIEKTQEENKQLYGFLITVPTQATKTIDITYTLSQLFPSDPAPSYSLMFFKQPGIDSFPYSFSFTPTSGYAPLLNGSDATQLGNDVVLQATITADKTVRLRFAAK